MKAQHVYEFGRFRLDAVERVLIRNDEPLPVPPKDIETLILLVERHGHIVEKEELLQKVWNGVFVEEGNLARRISNLRHLLGDAPEGHEFIETVPRRGYRFVAEVKEAVGVSEPQSIARTIETALPTEVRSSRRWLVWALLPAIGVLMIAGLLSWRHFSAVRAKASHRVMLAVLPVQNLSGDAEREYISDGLTEEMISQLGNLNPARLGVIARTSSMSYKGTARKVDQIGKDLAVNYILEASIRESGNRLRITAQLVRTSDQTHVWSHDYDTADGDILAIQNEIARTVAQQIQVSLIPEEEARLSTTAAVNSDTYDAYLKGRFFWNKRTPEDLNTAIRFFEQAIRSDPRFALGYAGLADSYQIQILWDRLLPQEGYARSRAAAQKALELDDRLAEAHTTLASIKEEYDWDWAGAGGEYKRALELNPNYATTHHWYAEFLAKLGRLDDATMEIKRAKELDPLSAVIATTLGEMECRKGHCDQAIAQYRKVLEIYPGYPQAQYLLAEAYARMGMYKQAVAEIRKAEQGPHLGAGWSSLTLAYAAATSGHKQDALILVERVRKEAGPRHVDFYLAILYAAAGQNDQAFTYLEAARLARDPDFSMIQADYRLDSIRSDPRYKDLLRRMNFPP